MTVEVRFETESVDITRAGILPPYKADHARVTVPGLTMAYVTVDGVELPPMTPEQFRAFQTVASIQEHSPASSRAKRDPDVDHWHRLHD